MQLSNEVKLQIAFTSYASMMNRWNSIMTQLLLSFSLLRILICCDVALFFVACQTTAIVHAVWFAINVNDIWTLACTTLRHGLTHLRNFELTFNQMEFHIINSVETYINI